MLRTVASPSARSGFHPGRPASRRLLGSPRLPRFVAPDRIPAMILAIMIALGVVPMAGPGGPAGGVALAMESDAAPPARAPGNLPELPRLDRSLDPDLGLGRVADLVRRRVVGTLSLLGSLTAGDIIATDGPITAMETPDGGARVSFNDLTMRLVSEGGDPVVIAIGDVIVDAADTVAGKIAFRSRIAGPILVYHAGAPVADLSVEALSLDGEIDPAVPVLGEDKLSVGSARLRITTAPDDSAYVRMGASSAASVSRRADDGTLGAEVTLTVSDLGAGIGEHDPTVTARRIESTSLYDGVPGAWLEVLRLLAASEQLPTLEQVTTTVGRVLGQNAIGNNDASMTVQDLEVFLSPQDSVTIDRLENSIVLNEPAGGGLAEGRTALSLTGLRTRGASLPVAVDIGALRFVGEGQGLDMGRLRGFSAETMRMVSRLSPTQSEAPRKTRATEALREIETHLIEGMADLVRDLALGEGKASFSLSGLAVRRARDPLLSLETLRLSGEWGEGRDGRLGGPTRLSLNELAVTDPSLGTPWRVGALEMDGAVSDLDLRALRSLAVLSMRAAAQGADMPDPAAVADVVNGMAVFGGGITATVSDIALGSDMNPQGGLNTATLSAELDPAEPGQATVGGRVSLSMDGLDAGPRGSRAAPPDVIPTAGVITLSLEGLPLPALIRLGMAMGSDPQAESGAMDRAAEDLITRHQPALSVETATLTAPAYDVEGDGRMAINGTEPDAFKGRFSVTIRGLDAVMTVLQERVRTDPDMEEPLLVVLALRGLGRVTAAGAYVYDIGIDPDDGMRINGTPLDVLMRAAQPQEETPAVPPPRRDGALEDMGRGEDGADPTPPRE